ncbi:MAG TPA: hypothetical protein VFE67_04840 [Rudaea sp.]|nr:hypothetical protein [Rudaea sp.]
MPKTVCCALVLLLASVEVHALDGFEKVQCGSDIPKALTGQRTSEEPVAAIEGRHAALGLKNLGGSEVTEKLFSASWQICGKEFALILDDHSVVRDALQFPAHSPSAPGFMGSCQVAEKKVPGTIIAVLKNEAGAELLAAEAAWKIDEKSAKFVKMPTDGLRCPRDGIFSVDGGQ